MYLPLPTGYTPSMFFLASSFPATHLWVLNTQCSCTEADAWATPGLWSYVDLKWGDLKWDLVMGLSSRKRRRKSRRRSEQQQHHAGQRPSVPPHGWLWRKTAEGTDARARLSVPQPLGWGLEKLLHLSEPWYNVSPTKDFKAQLGRSKEKGSVKALTTAPGTP